MNNDRVETAVRGHRYFKILKPNPPHAGNIYSYNILTFQYYYNCMISITPATVQHILYSKLFANSIALAKKGPV